MRGLVRRESIRAGAGPGPGAGSQGGDTGHDTGVFMTIDIGDMEPSTVLGRRLRREERADAVPQGVRHRA
ncbi:hypothetical protein GCM10023082_35400 [Streptomyces tremellae]|uniref:Uncharacterized protein n=1 Tax=Streptomyces tremellae TaxID=1124239 RepID=A0ABP7FED0_9ACTN